MLATNPNQVGQQGRIPLPVYYFFCLFNKYDKVLQAEWKKAVPVFQYGISMF